MRKRIGINIVYGIGIGLFLCSFSEILLENILIGPGWSETSDVFDLYGMICWLLIYSPVWGINFIFLEEDINLSDLVVARYRTAAKWWGQCILRCVIGNGCCYAALYITLAGLAGISGQMGKCCVMIILHGLLLWGVISIKIISPRQSQARASAKFRQRSRLPLLLCQSRRNSSFRSGSALTWAR